MLLPSGCVSTVVYVPEDSARRCDNSSSAFSLAVRSSFKFFLLSACTCWLSVYCFCLFLDTLLALHSSCSNAPGFKVTEVRKLLYCFPFLSEIAMVSPASHAILVNAPVVNGLNFSPTHLSAIIWQIFSPEPS